MSTAKQDVQELLNRLPDDCSIEDIQYQLYVIDKVRRGQQRVESEGGLSHDKAKQRLEKWIIQ